MARYLTIEDGREYLWDFDENRILLVTYGDTENIRQVEFSTDDTEGPTTWTSEVMTNPTTGNKYVQVPNEFLNGEYSRLVCYVIAEDETGQHTRTKEIFRIKKRQQPEDYEITFTDRVYIRDLKAIAERYRDQAKSYSESAAASSTQAGQHNTEALASKNAAALSAQQANQSMTLSKQYSENSAESASQAAATFNSLKEYVGSESNPSSALGQIYTAKENAKQEVTEHAESTKAGVIDTYVENTTKPAIDAFTEAQKKELDTYEKSKESELDTYNESQKAELNTHTASMKSQIDGYTTAKEQDISEFTEQKKSEVQGVYQTDLNELKGDLAYLSNKVSDKLLMGLSRYVLPSDFDMVSPVGIYTDGFKFVTDFDCENFKNIGGKTYYVDTRNLHLNDGLTKETATTLDHAYNLAVDGDTIVLLEGNYHRDNSSWAFVMKKSINIIGEGIVRWFDGTFCTFAKDDNYNNIYYASRSLAKGVIDISLGDDRYIPYENVSSIDECEANKGTYYYSNNIVYVNPISDGNPTGNIFVSVSYDVPLDISNVDGNVKVYVENITLIGKFNGVLINAENTDNSLDVCFNSVNVLFCGDESTYRDGIMVYGGNVVFNKCKSCNCKKDGFNYSGRNLAGTTYPCNVIEIDCVGASNGHGASSTSHNGSTAHQNAKVIRINGRYFDNYGGNVADVQTGTKSVNLGCEAYQSATGSGYSQGFTAQQAGTEMWLDNCIASGNVYDIYCSENATIHVDKSFYETKLAYNDTAIIEETNGRTLATMLMAKSN